MRALRQVLVHNGVLIALDEDGYLWQASFEGTGLPQEPSWEPVRGPDAVEPFTDTRSRLDRLEDAARARAARNARLEGLPAVDLDDTAT